MGQGQLGQFRETVFKSGVFGGRVIKLSVRALA